MIQEKTPIIELKDVIFSCKKCNLMRFTFITNSGKLFAGIARYQENKFQVTGIVELDQTAAKKYEAIAQNMQAAMNQAKTIDTSLTDALTNVTTATIVS